MVDPLTPANGEPKQKLIMTKIDRPDGSVRAVFTLQGSGAFVGMIDASAGNADFMVLIASNFAHAVAQDRRRVQVDPNANAQVMREQQQHRAAAGA